MNPTLKDVEAAVCIVYGFTTRQLKGSGAKRLFCRPRQLAMHLARNVTSQSYPQIGAFFGRDHTTVIHADRTMAELLIEDADLNREYLRCLHTVGEVTRYRVMEAALQDGTTISARPRPKLVVVPKPLTPKRLAIVGRPANENTMRRAWRKQAKLTRVSGSAY